jgi:type I restriction enzyme M protein
LARYLNAEKRDLIGRVENLWEKYAVSSEKLEIERKKTLKDLENIFEQLRYKN